MTMNTLRSGLAALAGALALAVSNVRPAPAIPAFARRYHVSCQLCHNPIPKLTAFGERFAANGYRFAPGEQPRDSAGTGDSLLVLLGQLPLAVRLDAYAQAYANGRAATDLELPYSLKLLSGGSISGDLSYYLYFFLFERGEVGGIEDAFVYLNDVAGTPVDVAVGQFQVSDPLFKRELRLEYQDYAVYRTRVGSQPADFTYDRGILVSADVAGFTASALVVNGNGRGPAGGNRRLDDDPNKNFMGYLTRDLAKGLRLGALGYYGRQQGAAAAGPLVTNRIRMWGADATLEAGPVELNGQFIWREDDKPTFNPGEPKTITKGGFGELIFRPRGNRWYAVGLYNLVKADRPLLDPRLGGPANIARYETVTAGLGYLLRRNARVFAEGTWDRQAQSTAWTVGLVTAF